MRGILIFLGNLRKGGKIYEMWYYVRVSTNNQRDNGYFIDSQLRMIKE